MRIFKVVVWIIVAIVGLWLAGIIGLSAYFTFAAPESPIVDDSDLRIVEPPIPDEENAYLAFIAMTNLLESSSDDMGACSNFRLKIGKEVDPSVIDRILEEHKAVFPALEQIASMPKYRFVPEGGTPLPFYIPPVSTFGRLQSLCEVKIIRLLEQGDCESAFKIARAGYKFMVLVSGNSSSLVEFLVGAGFNEAFCKRLVEVANAENISDEILAEMTELLEEEFDETEISERTMKCEYQNCSLPAIKRLGENIGFNDLAQFLFEVLDVPFVEKITPRRVMELPGLAKFAFNQGMTQQDIVEFYRVGLAGGDVENLLPAPRSVFQPNWGGRLLARAVAPAFFGLKGSWKSRAVRTREVMVAVAAIRYARANGGKLPTKLAELVPTYLKDVPRDPYDPGKELGYDCERGLVWSVGKYGKFDPLAEKVSVSFFNREMEKCALRIDGKPHEKRKPPSRKKRSESLK